MIDFGNNLMMEIGKINYISEENKSTEIQEVVEKLNIGKVFPFPSFCVQKGPAFFYNFLCFTFYQVKVCNDARQALSVQDQLFNPSRLPVPASVLPQRLQQVATQPSPAL
jgi:hypothetical protein